MVASAGAAPFRFESVGDKSIGLWEGDRAVLVYNFGVMEKPGVPRDRARSSYIHPMYGLDGEVLTDDFPKDHYHHRGLFWAWPHVKSGGKEYDLWMIKGIAHRFEKFGPKVATDAEAAFTVENSWVADSKVILREMVAVTVHPASKDSRAIDLDFTWIPVDNSITLAGAEGKSYGGLTLRFATNKNTVITTPLGNGKEDLPMTRLPWADLTGQFAGPSQPSGAAIFIPKSHPDYPPMWLTRHYGVLCLGWPGIDAQTFPAGKEIRCQYRVWIHRGAADGKQLAGAYEQYLKEAKPR